jgi:hypothetical protein
MDGVHLYHSEDRRRFADKGRKVLENLDKLADTVEVSPQAAMSMTAVARAWIELAKL